MLAPLLLLVATAAINVLAAFLPSALEPLASAYNRLVTRILSVGLPPPAKERCRVTILVSLEQLMGDDIARGRGKEDVARRSVFRATDALFGWWTIRHNSRTVTTDDGVEDAAEHAGILANARRAIGSAWGRGAPLVLLFVSALMLIYIIGMMLVLAMPSLAPDTLRMWLLHSLALMMLQLVSMVSMRSILWRRKR